METEIVPCPPLREYARSYLYREAELAGAVLRPLRARFDPLLVFQLGEPCEVFEYREGRRRVLPPAFIVGPQTRRLADLLLRGRSSMFVVSFQPAGLARLFGARMSALTDRAYEASDVLGDDIVRLHEQLLGASDIREMADAAERALLARLPHAGPFHAIERAARFIQCSPGQVDLARLARDTGLGARQFERLFIERVGVAPKRYARVARVDFALRLKARQPHRTWTDVSHAAGYFDQAHMAKDFRALVGVSPSASLFYYPVVRPVA